MVKLGNVGNAADLIDPIFNMAQRGLSLSPAKQTSNGGSGAATDLPKLADTQTIASCSTQQYAYANTSTTNEPPHDCYNNYAPHAIRLDLWKRFGNSLLSKAPLVKRPMIKF